MAKDPAFLFYSQDWIVGTMTMTFEDKGKYITILSQMHQQGRMTEETIRFMVGSVSDNLRLKFSIDKNNLWFNKRLELEAEKRRNFSESRRTNGLKGGRPKKSKPIGNHMGNHMGDGNENEGRVKSKDVNELDLYPTFEDFWNLYDHKVSKKKAEPKWDKLKQADKELIMLNLPLYIQSTPNKDYRKHPVTYLINESWNDEITQNYGHTQNGQEGFVDAAAQHLAATDPDWGNY